MWGPLAREFVAIFQEGVAALPGELPMDFDRSSPCLFPPWISQCIGPGHPSLRITSLEFSLSHRTRVQEPAPQPAGPARLRFEWAHPPLRTSL